MMVLNVVALPAIFIVIFSICVLLALPLSRGIKKSGRHGQATVVSLFSIGLLIVSCLAPTAVSLIPAPIDMSESGTLMCFGDFRYWRAIYW